jgi:hypothetical protein
MYYDEGPVVYFKVLPDTRHEIQTKTKMPVRPSSNQAETRSGHLENASSKRYPSVCATVKWRCV